MIRTVFATLVIGVLGALVALRRARPTGVPGPVAVSPSAHEAPQAQSGDVGTESGRDESVDEDDEDARESLPDDLAPNPSEEPLRTMRAILHDAGGPLTREALLAETRLRLGKQRIHRAKVALASLFEVNAGVYGLPERDDLLGPARRRLLVEDIWAVLGAHETLPLAELRERLLDAELIEPEVMTPWLIRATLASDRRFEIGPGSSIRLASAQTD